MNDGGDADLEVLSPSFHYLEEKSNETVPSSITIDSNSLKAAAVSANNHNEGFFYFPKCLHKYEISRRQICSICKSTFAPGTFLRREISKKAI